MRSQNSFIIRRRNIKQLFILYSCALFYTVFLTPNRYRGDEKEQINLLPVVNNIKRFYGQGGEHFWPYYIGYWGNIFGNIFLMVPFGFLFKCLSPGKSAPAIFVYGLLLSVSIELAQLILQIGVCDIDDVILNMLGVWVGILLYTMLKKKKPDWFVEL